MNYRNLLLACGIALAAAFALSQDVRGFAQRVTTLFQNRTAMLLLDLAMTVASAGDLCSSWVPALSSIPGICRSYFWSQPGNSSQTPPPRRNPIFNSTSQQLLIPYSYENMTFREELAAKGKGIINALQLTEYSENGDCDVQAGLSFEDFPVTEPHCR